MSNIPKSDIVGEGTTSFIIKTQNPKFVKKKLKTDSKIYKELLKLEYDNYMFFYKNCKPLKKYLIDIKDYNPNKLCFTMSNLLELGFHNLFSVMDKKLSIIDTNKIIICNHMVDFLQNLHLNAKYTHSDIKPNNIFINPTKMLVKFIDFGFSKPYNPEQMYNPLGTILFSNPEMITGIISKNKLLGTHFFKNDWWGLGITIVFLLYHNEYLNYKKFMQNLINKYKENSKKINLRRNMERYRIRFDKLLFDIFNIHFFD
jgi:serine/threonine protein kinase